MQMIGGHFWESVEQSRALEARVLVVVNREAGTLQNWSYPQSHFIIGSQHKSMGIQEALCLL